MYKHGYLLHADVIIQRVVLDSHSVSMWLCNDVWLLFCGRMQQHVTVYRCVAVLWQDAATGPEASPPDTPEKSIDCTK